ncbi:MAG TPA: hypothetical protein VF898_01260 [Chloroflexota bacterium]
MDGCLSLMSYLKGEPGVGQGRMARWHNRRAAHMPAGMGDTVGTAGTGETVGREERGLRAVTRGTRTHIDAQEDT